MCAISLMTFNSVLIFFSVTSQALESSPLEEPYQMLASVVPAYGI